MTSPEQPDTSDGESVIRRYDAPTGPRELSNGDDELIERVSEHVQRHLGPVEQVFHEVISPTVHVDIHWVAKSWI